MIENANEPVKAEFGSAHGRFPNLPLLNLAISQHAVHLKILLLKPSCKRHSDCGRQALPQWSGGHVYAGRLKVGRALKMAVYLPKPYQVIHGKEASAGQGGVQDRGGVTLA